MIGSSFAGYAFRVFAFMNIRAFADSVIEENIVAAPDIESP